MPAAAPAAAHTCRNCQTQIAPGLLACPSCDTLVHASRLRELAGTADAATRESRIDAAIAAWRDALVLLPPGSRQHEAIRGTITSLFRSQAAAEDPPVPAAGGKRGKWGIAVVLAFIASKGKLLLLGLSKGSTVLSMLASVGVYWAAWGLSFAAGFVASIYVHEMGHVAALRRYGVPATAPMFIPGLGAFIRVQHMPSSPAETARVGLAGPLWGLGAAVAAYVAFLATGNPFWAAIARTGAWLNVFNLTPVWQLDGSRGFAALSNLQRWLLVLAVAAAWLATGEGLLLLVLVVAAARMFFETAPETGDHGALGLYVFLIVSLAGLAAGVARA